MYAAELPLQFFFKLPDLSSGMGHDLLFLDIELEGSASGMDGNAINGMGMARQIRGMEQIKQPIIIFVTGYEKYVYDAFDTF